MIQALADRSAGDDDRKYLADAPATLAREVDALYAVMQDPEMDACTARGFCATPEEMGRAALAEARRLPPSSSVPRGLIYRPASVHNAPHSLHTSLQSTAPFGI
jgi:hypothetical protein